MNDDEVTRSPALEALLARAKESGPPRARLDAVRARLEGQLGPLGATGSATAPRREPTDAPMDTATNGGATTTAGWMLAGALAITLGLGTWALVRSMTPAAPEPDAPPATTEATAHETMPTSAPRPAEARPAEARPAEAGPAEAGPAEAAPAETAPAEAGPAEAGPAEPGPRAPSVSGERERTHEQAAAAPVEEADDGSSLREETLLLERAMRLRREGDEGGARAALREHASRFPDGLLAPERTRFLRELEAAE